MLKAVNAVFFEFQEGKGNAKPASNGMVYPAGKSALHKFHTFLHRDYFLLYYLNINLHGFWVFAPVFPDVRLTFYLPTKKHINQYDVSTNQMYLQLSRKNGIIHFLLY